MRCSAIIAAILSGLLWAAQSHAAVIIDDGTNNGGFESNGGTSTSTFTSWNVVNQTGGSGDWYVQTSTSSQQGNTVPVPPQGTYAAMTDATAAGSHILYQNFVVPMNVTSATLSFDYYVNNLAAGNTFSTPTGTYSPASAQYDYSNAPNQEAYVDITNNISTADWTTAAGVGVVDQVFTAAAQQLTYTTATVDLTSLFQSNAGSTLALRFTEVDGGQALLFGIDKISLTYNASSPSVVPEPASIAIWWLSIFGFAACRRRRKLVAGCAA